MSWRTTQPSLLARVRDPEDQRAWEEFDRRYGELIVRYCRSRSLQQSDAEDVRQIVLMNLSSALRRFEYQPGRGRFRSYLGCVVRNAIARYAGRRQRDARGLDPQILDLEAVDDGEHDPRWEEEWTAHHLRRAMDVVRRSHDPKSLEVFDRLLAGGDVREVAATLGLSTDAVHKIKQRCARPSAGHHRAADRGRGCGRLLARRLIVGGTRTPGAMTLAAARR